MNANGDTKIYSASYSDIDILILIIVKHFDVPLPKISLFSRFSALWMLRSIKPDEIISTGVCTEFVSVEISSLAS